MGNCMKEPAPIDVELRSTSALRDSVSNSGPPQLTLNQLTEAGTSPEVDRKIVISPSSSMAIRSDVMTFDKTAEISKSIDNLAKQIDHSRMWQEEAKLTTLQRKSMEAKIPSYPYTPGLHPDYLDLEQELEERMDTLMGGMGTIKEEVELLERKAKRLSRQCSAY